TGGAALQSLTLLARRPGYATLHFTPVPRSASRRAASAPAGSSSPRSGPAGSSCQDLLDHTPMHVRQAEVAPGVPIRQLLVVQPQDVQKRRVQVMDVDLVLHGEPAVVVRRPVAEPALHAGPGQPHREALRVVVAA